MNIIYTLFCCYFILSFSGTPQTREFDRNDFAFALDSTKVETTVIDTSVVDSTSFAPLPKISKRDSIKFKEMKKFNPTLWDKINEETLCTGMKAPVQYRNGKIVRNN